MNYMKAPNSKDTNAMRYFAASFKKWYDESGLNLVEAGVIFDLSHTFISRLLKRKASISLGTAELIATRINKDLIEMLTEGRSLLGEKPKTVKDRVNDPFEKVIADFRFLLWHGGETAEFLTKFVSDYATTKKIDTNNQDPITKQGLKSAS